MNEERNEIKPKKMQTHIALSEAASARITNWIEQIEAKKKGVLVSRKDFINWLIEKTPDNLSSGDLSALIERFYDEASFLRQRLREVQTAKKEGRVEPSLKFLIHSKRVRKKKEVNVSSEELTDKKNE